MAARKHVHCSVIGSIAVHLTSAQRRQGGLRSVSDQSRRPRYFRTRGPSSGSGTLTRSNRRQVLPGPRHVQAGASRSRAAQRLTNARGGLLSRRPSRTGSIRLTGTGTRRQLNRPINNAMLLAALRRRSQPIKIARTQPSRTSNLPLLGLKPSMINDQLSIFARNLEVINGTIDLTRDPTSAKTGHAKGTKSTPTKTTQTSRTNRMTPINGRTTARISVATGRGSSTTTGSRIVPPTKSPINNSRLRIRARLRQISSQAPETARNMATGPSNINTRMNGEGNRNGGGGIRNGGGGGNPNGGGGNASGRSRDMVALDDIISLVQAIRGSKEPRQNASQRQTRLPTPNLTNTKNNSIRANKSINGITPKDKSNGRRKKTSIRKVGSNNSKALRNNNKMKASTSSKPNSPSANNGNYFGSPMEMFAQLAMMGGGEGGMGGGEGGGGLFGGMMSNPAFLKQMSAGGGNTNLMQMLAASGMSEPGRKGNNNPLSKENAEINANQSILKQLNAIKLTKTGNPVQDQMVSSMLDQTMKHLREEIQEGIRKRLTDGDSPPSGRDRATSRDPI